MTIISNVFSVYRVRALNRLTSNYILPCRRRTDDTRRVLIVITVECLFAIVNSWFSDILLSLVYCKRSFLADDDCPLFLSQNYDLLIMFDMFNSISNIILHCLCGKHFRNELRRMFQPCSRVIQMLLSRMSCCYIQIRWQQKNSDRCISYNAFVTGPDSSNSSDRKNTNQVYLKIRTSSRSERYRCCDCRWYFNRRPLFSSQRCLSAVSKECLRKNRTPVSVHYRALKQHVEMKDSTSIQWMKLYFPKESSVQHHH